MVIISLSQYVRTLFCELVEHDTSLFSRLQHASIGYLKTHILKIKIKTLKKSEVNVRIANISLMQKNTNKMVEMTIVSSLHKSTAGTNNIGYLLTISKSLK